MREHHNDIEMVGVREYAEEMPVHLFVDTRPNEKYWKGSGRVVLKAYNEAGFNHVMVDLLDVIAWLKKNRPELLGDA
jgi:hypothetical protein